MEKKKENNRSVEEHIRRQVKPIFDKVLQEAPPNPMRVQNGPEKVTIKAVQPHNYRLYFDFTKEKYNPTEPYSLKNYNSEHHYLYPTHRIVIRKRTIEVQYLAHQKQWRRIIADSEEGIDKRMDEIVQEIEDKCFTYLKQFVSMNGGKTEFKLLRKRKQEWGIHGDEYLDNIPDEMIITDTVFKKVYRDKVEMHGPNEVKNWISNRALEKFSPQISDSINSLAKKIRTSQDVEIIKKASLMLINCFINYINDE